MKIALLGAPGTGKTWLAHALGARLQSRGCAVQMMSPCEPGLTGKQVLIADGTALLVAVRRDIEQQDHSLYSHAIATQASFDLTLMTGLDLPQAIDTIQQRIDARLREVLQAHGLRYSVVYGRGDQRLACALAAVDQWESPRSWDFGDGQPRWQWVCDKCSDAQCEHQLFSALLGNERQDA